MEAHQSLLTYANYSSHVALPPDRVTVTFARFTRAGSTYNAEYNALQILPFLLK